METICLLLRNKNNRQLLGAWLKETYLVIDVEESLPEEPFDLCITDGPSLNRLSAQYRFRKEQESTAFLPFLLVTLKRDINLLTRRLWEIIDEVVTAPVQKAELHARIQILLRSRRMSLQAQQNNNILRQEKLRLLETIRIADLHAHELHVSEWRFRVAVDNFPHVFILFDAAGKVTYANKYSRQKVGLPLESVIGKQMQEVVPEEVYANYLPILLKVIETLTSQTGEATYRYKGEETTMIINFVPLLDEKNRISEILCIAVDITERKHWENEREKLLSEQVFIKKELQERAADLQSVNRELESFSYSVSHDLRSPINAIQGFITMLFDDYGEKLGQQGHDYLNRIQTSTKKMQSIIDDMITLSHVGRHELASEEFNLSDWVKAFLNTLHTSQPDRRSTFRVQDGLKVKTDPGLIQIALENLLRNAWKFTSKILTTEIEFGSVIQNDKAVYFVRDNGVGFDMKHVGRLFQPFQRLHGEKDFPGTGIGLATVHRIIHRLGGEIWAQGEVNGGSTFFFTLR